MANKQIPEVGLNSGHKMPVIAFGTAKPHPPSDVLISACLNAIEAGYRHFDTASLYGSEEHLGKAIAQALQKGLIKSRDELFITSKAWCTECDRDLVLPSLKESLERLGLEYVDLFLVHWPVKVRHGAHPLEFSKEDILPFDVKGTWEAMEECSKLGLAKSIGLSNFTVKKISQLLEHATIPPAVNQVEMNVGWQQKKLLDFCKEKGIYLCAWSPLGGMGAKWGSDAVMESPILKEIAVAQGKSLAQIALRWIHEQGAIPIAKSFNKERMTQNLQIFDWELSQEDLEKMKQIPQRRGFLGEVFISENGPYKTVEELWDGEI